MQAVDVCRLPGARPQPTLQASRLSYVDVNNASTQIVYDWIRGQAQNTPIARTARISDHLPSNPDDQSDGLVDIVVITPESASRHTNPNLSSTDHLAVEESMQGDVANGSRYMKGECPSFYFPAHVYPCPVVREEVTKGILHHLSVSSPPPSSRKPCSTPLGHGMEDSPTALDHPRHFTASHWRV